MYMFVSILLTCLHKVFWLAKKNLQKLSDIKIYHLENLPVPQLYKLFKCVSKVRIHNCSYNTVMYMYQLFRYHDGNLYVIDVSQSVEHDHPHALEFLRKDCTNVTGLLLHFLINCLPNCYWPKLILLFNVVHTMK